MITTKEYNNAVIFKDMAERFGQPIPQEVLDIIATYEAHMGAGSSTPIYSKLKAENIHGVSEEKARCVEETVAELLSEAPNASEPGLLLGKIQCGKTDTFEMIIGLAFDKGFDIAVVLTKNSTALAQQTVARFEGDFRHFTEGPTPTVVIEDIMDRKSYAPNSQKNSKLILVVKKEATNMKHLINRFSLEKNKWLRDKRVLIVDDEADFASRNYRNVRKEVLNDSEGNPIPQQKETDMAVISKQIDEFRQIPHFCRYLQVTATPYCLLLQPDDKIKIVDGEALCFRPRFTKLVPIHNKYIGGQQYFIDSQDGESMFSHLFYPVTQKCIDVLGQEDKRYINNNVKSNNIAGLTRALMAYIMATAIRRIQDGVTYVSSAVFHVSIAKDDHKWQANLINAMLPALGDYFAQEEGTNENLDNFFREIYHDFEVSNIKARRTGKEIFNTNGELIFSKKLDKAMPSKEEIRAEINRVFDEYKGALDEFVKVVNSDEDIHRFLDERTGQLRLESAFNIFIGGNNLDRGITVNNMLCFFYGRNPGSYQQDTVLQHARFYGAREIEDMAVTRMYTTMDIYNALARINQLDDDLRNRFINGTMGNEKMTFVGYDTDIKPCAMSKIAPSKVESIFGGRNFAPRGMQTGSASEISATVKEIDSLIAMASADAKKDENGFFLMDAKIAMRILELIETTYRYDEKYDNLIQDKDMAELRSALAYSSEECGGRVWALHSIDRNMSRQRKNGYWVDMPADGNTELNQAKVIGTDIPVLILLRENGSKEQGWRNTPFYWPVLHCQANLEPVLIAHGVKAKGMVKITDISKIFEGLDISDDKILRAYYTDPKYIEVYGEEGNEFSLEEASCELFTIRRSDYGKYLNLDFAGRIALAEGVTPTDIIAGVYSYNNGRFPFELRPCKYLLLQRGLVAKEALLLELFPVDVWHVFAHQNFDEAGNLYDYVDCNKKLIGKKDILTDEQGLKTEFENNDLCQWIVNIPVKKVLRHVVLEKTKDDDSDLIDDEE